MKKKMSAKTNATNWDENSSSDRDTANEVKFNWLAKGESKKSVYCFPISLELFLPWIHCFDNINSTQYIKQY